jgi:hypothetical protein
MSKLLLAIEGAFVYTIDYTRLILDVTQAEKLGWLLIKFNNQANSGSIPLSKTDLYQHFIFIEDAKINFLWRHRRNWGK